MYIVHVIHVLSDAESSHTVNNNGKIRRGYKGDFDFQIFLPSEDSSSSIKKCSGIFM